MIVIAAAGLSSRFRQEGYMTPKFMLPLGKGRTVFDEVLEGFRDYRTSEAFVVAARADQGVPDFLRDRLKSHGIERFYVSEIESPQGMMPDIEHALTLAPFSHAQPLVISVSDIFRLNFTMPETPRDVITVDFGLRPNQIMPRAPGFISAVKTSDGLGCYHMHNAQDFLAAYAASRKPLVRSLFNEKVMEATEGLGTMRRLKALGYRFVPRIVTAADYVHCGRPVEYQRLLKN